MQEKQFVQKGARKVRMDEYLEEQLEGAGYSHNDIVRTPTSTKIVIHAERPGLVIGRGGSRIQELTEDMEKEFDFENPQIEVNEIEEGDAKAQVVAKSMASWLEKGGSAKRVGYTYLRRMKEAGVIGAEIEISGKLSGNRGRTEKFSYGYVKRCGDTAKQNVEIGYKLARTKPGAIGVKVRIMKDLPEFKHRDVDVQEEILHQTIEHGGDETPASEKIDMIIAEADNMTAAAISEAAERLEVNMDDISVDEVRDVFEGMDEDDIDEVESESEDEEEDESKADEEIAEPDAEESEEGDSSTEYAEVVDGTISDAKEQLEEMEDPDYEQVLEEEKSNKNRKTFIDWIEARV